MEGGIGGTCPARSGRTSDALGQGGKGADRGKPRRQLVVGKNTPKMSVNGG